MSDFTAQCRDFEAALLAIDRVAAAEVYQGCQSRASPLTVADQVFVPALENIGDAWQKGSVALSQVYLASKICEELIDSIHWPRGAIWVDHPPLALAVYEDHHLLGKRILFSMLRAAGFQVQDFGRVDKDELVSRVEREGIQLLLVSTLMLRSALRVRELTRELRRRKLKVATLVGGAPFRFDPTLWRQVGAASAGMNGADAIRWLVQATGVKSWS